MRGSCELLWISSSLQGKRQSEAILENLDIDLRPRKKAYGAFLYPFCLFLSL